ncbi:hypothetical protein GGR32_001580 [Mesonia hippocampi]|uniref:Uncharacterized protein n=1 Tax=Mesonia hippocampi TaxID=1628250 RepID=A0A840EIW6_9FLAO|nr:hypothetical protein [Mesonia hippocampi]
MTIVKTLPSGITLKGTSKILVPTMAYFTDNFGNTRKTNTSINVYNLIFVLVHKNFIS